MKDFNFKIVQHFGVLGRRGKWDLELNSVSWAGDEPKWDIRSWSPEHDRCGKGITLSTEEAIKLADLLKTETFGD